MEFEELGVQGTFLISVEPFVDERGFFARTFDARHFSERGLDIEVVQCSTSFNHHRGTLRGMHLQLAPHGETKLIRCTRGRIFDVLLDLRPKSSTYLKSASVELAADTPSSVYIPKGVAHGFLTLEANSEVAYQISTPYDRASAAGVRWNDPTFAIDWPLQPMMISERDHNFPDFDPDNPFPTE